MPLTRTEQDLQQFAADKVLRLMKDVAQSFEIAGFGGGDTMACLGAVFLKVTIQIAVAINAPKHEFLAKVSETFDEITNDERRN